MDTVSAVSHSASDSSLTTSVANVLAVSFGVLFSFITRANLCYCIYYLQCKEVMAEYSGLCSSPDLSPLFNLEQLSFNSPWGSQGTFLLPWIDPLLSQMTRHFGLWQEQQSVEINFVMWTLIPGFSSIFLHEGYHAIGTTHGQLAENVWGL